MIAAPAGIAADETFDLLLPPGDPVCAPAPAGVRAIALSGETMGTGWSLEALVPQGIEDVRVETTLERCSECVIAQMSQWRPDSQLSRFNSGDPGSRHAVGPQFRQVLECAFTVGRASRGAFDPLLGKAISAWGFGPSAIDRPPDAGERLPCIASGSILTDDPGTIVQPGGIVIDLSGIAKGFAVDMAMAALMRLGIAHALLDIGGELKAIGLRADGLPWWVDLAVPPGSAARPTRIGLTGWAVASSGHWERRRYAQDRSWSHTLDPVSGAPTHDALSCTVLHPGCMQADALATALIVLGVDDGIALADRHRFPARIVGPERVAESAAWHAWKA
ncbi:FAD:protein FMN transferase [Qipengyuania sp. MTN3-11]|uniref:FAD:protein FMN transferase n=1 Tax=Qipengyuania sp. MTN3-11 TaxID=3056557 RepID=UPI0036F23ADD